MKETTVEGMDRREFMKRAGATAVALGAFPAVFRAQAQSAPSADQIIKGKIPEMIVHNARLGVMETPLNILRKYEHTPKEALYVRNHFPVSGAGAWYATTDPINDDNWEIRIGGLVGRPAKITVGELKKMKLVEVPAVLQCSGNGRSFYAKKAKTPGSQWKHGGMGNVVWRGVLLKDLFEALAVEFDAAARYLTANGKDRPTTPKGSDFVHSFPLHEVLKKAILAVEMNGEPIPAVHGGPVRLFIPGYYGTMQIKWLTDLYVTEKESPSKFQQHAYRVPLYPVQPGEMTPADFNEFNSIPNWGMKIKTVIFSPLDGESVKPGMVKVTGVSWNDGLVPVKEVFVSADRGKSWTPAKIVKKESPYAWHFWEAYVALSSGTREIWARAVDAWGRGQPLDGVDRWNPKGYEWNGTDKISIKVG